MKKIRFIINIVKASMVALASIALTIASVMFITRGDIVSYLVVSAANGVFTFILTLGKVFKKTSNTIVKLLLTIALGNIVGFIGVYRLVEIVLYLKSCPDSMGKNSDDRITFDDGRVFHVISEFLYDDMFYDVIQPNPLPKSYHTNTVDVFSVTPIKGQKGRFNYKSIKGNQLTKIVNVFNKLKKQNKIKCNPYLVGFYERDYNQLLEYIKTNALDIRSLDALDANKKDDVNYLRKLIIGNENQILFFKNGYKHEWTNDELKSIARYYLWQVKWAKDINNDFVVAQGERLEINHFYRLCNLMNGIIAEQRKNALGAITAEQFNNAIVNTKNK